MDFLCFELLRGQSDGMDKRQSGHEQLPVVPWRSEAPAVQTIRDPDRSRTIAIKHCDDGIRPT
jgi:hypothetical protein